MDLDSTHQYIVHQRTRTLGVLAVVLAIIRWRRRIRNRRHPRKYGPLVDRDLVRKTRLDDLYNGSDTTCISQLRMRKEVFWKLASKLRDNGLLCDTIHVSVEEQLAMFLHTVGHNLRNRVIGFYVIRSSETVSRYFNEVLKALCCLAKDMIQIRSIETHSKIVSNPGRFYPYFEDCIGALDGTHIPAFVPENIVNRFRGRKSYPTQNVLAAVDFDLRFTYVLAGWEGSAHDLVVLKAALRRSSGIQIPEGKYYLADAGYAARPGILPPFRGVRYHLKEYEGGKSPETPQELFNLRHSSLRTSVERAFGTLKNRFKVLASKPFFPYKVQVKIVIACCVLHNWILDNGPDNIIYDEARWYSKLPRSARVATDYGEEHQQWVEFRENLANIMWEEH
ncbi:protein ALP1-like isoform X2 [Oryza sativa Japonica Group]|nr:protein ALP1-like isoform X2 [Oryza sativa Japonica Group]